jgi:AcrR family transcriptional regulator
VAWCANRFSMSASASAPAVTSLTTARRAFTRDRIFTAAKEVFFLKGFGLANFDDIAKAAGTKRSTLYTYFRDKDEIITAIAEEYGDRVERIVAELPGPVPTRAQSDAWIDTLAAFVIAERTPTELLSFMGHLVEVPPAVERFGDRLMAALAARVSAFEAALQPGGERALAWATIVVRELGWALCYNARHRNSVIALHKLEAVRELFSRFVQGKA